VDRRFAFGPKEKEKFRALMRLQEKFTGGRVVSYCLMCNRFHLLLKVPPMADSGLIAEQAFSWNRSLLRQVSSGGSMVRRRIGQEAFGFVRSGGGRNAGLDELAAVITPLFPPCGPATGSISGLPPKAIS
jgi:hypothetical protein